MSPLLCDRSAGRASVGTPSAFPLLPEGRDRDLLVSLSFSSRSGPILELYLSPHSSPGRFPVPPLRCDIPAGLGLPLPDPSLPPGVLRDRSDPSRYATSFLTMQMYSALPSHNLLFSFQPLFWKSSASCGSATRESRGPSGALPAPAPRARWSWHRLQADPTDPAPPWHRVLPADPAHLGCGYLQTVPHPGGPCPCRPRRPCPTLAPSLRRPFPTPAPTPPYPSPPWHRVLPADPAPPRHRDPADPAPS